MVNSDKIRGLMAEHRMTKVDLGILLHLNPRTVYDKLRSGVFRTDEVEIMIKHFNLTDPVDIVKVFFPDVLRNTQHEGR